MYLPGKMWVRRLSIILIFFGAALLIYGASLRNGFMVIDDDLYVYQNPAVWEISPRSLRTIFTTYDPELYVPLTFLSYQIDYLIGGLDPFVYHATSLFLHTLNALLVSLLCATIVGSRRVGLACGMLFLVHPLNTEAVAWIAGRKDVLSTTFLLAALLSYARYREGGRKAWYVAGIGAAVLGLLSKVVVAMLPFIIVIDHVRKKQPWDRGAVRDLAPFLLLSVIFIFIGLQGKTGVMRSSSLTEKILMAGKSTFFSVRSFFFPIDLHVLYTQETPVTFTAEFLLPALFCIALIGATALFWRRNRNAAFGMLFFLIMLAPSFINFAKHGGFFFASDRYAYAPAIGLLIAVSAIILRLPIVSRKRAENIFSVLFTILIIILGGASFNQSRHWSDGITLFTRELRYSPHSAVALVNRAVAFTWRGDYASAEKDLLAVEEKAYEVSVNLGLLYALQGKLEEAKAQYLQALAFNITSARAHAGIAEVFRKMGNENEAREAFRNARKLDPEFMRSVYGESDSGDSSGH